MKQLQDIEQKDIIKRVTGRITKLWEPKTFNGPKGEFTIQGGEIEIDGDHYGLKFFNQQHDSDKLKGRTVTLVSTRGKHGLNGVTLDHESFSKKDGEKVDRDVIKVTATGKIEIDGEQQQQSAPKAVIVADNDPKITLDKLVESHMYINDLVRVAYAKKGYNEETLRSYVASIFIEANKRGIQVSHVEAKPAYDPADWASAIVPSGSNKGKTLGSVGKPALKKLYAYYLEKGFDSDFAKCVEQAGADLKLDDEGIDEPLPLEEQDDIPW